MNRKQLLLTLFLIITLNLAFAQRFEVTNFQNASGAYGMSYDSRGYLWYSASSGHTIYYHDGNKEKIAAGGVGNPGYKDGQGVGIRFDSPKGILAVERGGIEVLVVADAGNNLVRFLSINNLAAIVTSKILDVKGFNDPCDIEADASGNIYVADRQNYVIKKIDALGTVSIVAGQLGVSGKDDGDATAKATFTSPTGIYVDGNDIYVADAGALRKISNGSVSTIALEPDYDFSYNMGGLFNVTDIEKMGDTWLLSDGCTIRKFENGKKYFQTFAGSNYANDCGNKVNENDTFARFETVYQLLYNEGKKTLMAADFGNGKIKEIKESGVGFNEKRLNETTLFPNPASGQVFIQGLNSSKGKNIKVSVINITGKIVYSQEHSIKGDQLALNLDKFNSGLYLVTMSINQEVVTKKLYVK